MANKLTSITKQKNTETLTSNTVRNFSVLFSDEIEKIFDLSKLEKSDSHKLIKFIHLATSLSWDQVDKKYLRKNDKTDVKEGHDIIHYGLTDKFRLHGYIDKGSFIIIRVDPNHKVHS